MAEHWIDSLSSEESQAIKAWTGVHYSRIRNVQLGENDDPEAIALEAAFTAALVNADVCTELVYRGLSAGSWRKDAMSYVQSFIDGPDPLALPTHDSATTDLAMARSWTRTRADDEERNLSVLLRISPLTARYLRPFQHNAGDESEVVLLRGSKYRRSRVYNKGCPKSGLRYYEVDLEEVT